MATKIITEQIQNPSGPPLTLPVIAGAANSTVVTDSNGNLSFATISSLLPTPVAGGLLATDGTNLSWSTGGTSDPAVLYKCSSWDGGGVCIPAGNRGKYNSYEIQGQVGRWSNYCSQLTFSFAGACSGGCSGNEAGTWCCAHNTCGWIGDHKCFNSSSQYSCAGAIAWPFGCETGCSTACSLRGWQFHIALNPWGYNSDGNKFAHYCINTTNQGGGEYCCIGIRNVGELCSCCGGDTGCLRCVCFTTPSGSNGVGCCSSITVIGRGKLI